MINIILFLWVADYVVQQLFAVTISSLTSQIVLETDSRKGGTSRSGSIEWFKSHKLSTFYSIFNLCSPQWSYIRVCTCDTFDHNREVLRKGTLCILRATNLLLGELHYQWTRFMNLTSVMCISSKWFFTFQNSVSVPSSVGYAVSLNLVRGLNPTQRLLASFRRLLEGPWRFWV